MHTPRLASCLLALAGCSFVGCAQTGVLRPDGPSNMKTVASVGDKSLPIVAGDPSTGSTTRVESEQLDLGAPSGSKISGRVFDDRGKPVPKAIVRLVVGGVPAGKDNFATTDRSGAFTLHDLRAGQTYTLIAESQGDDGMMSGRTEAKVPQTDVRIRVATHGNSSEPQSMSIRPARTRVKPNPDPDQGDQDGFPPIIRSGANADEVDEKDTPAEEEAASLAPRSNRQSATRLASTSSAPIRAGLNASDRAANPVTRTSARTKGRAVEADKETDDGENPLPPAQEAEDSGPTRLASRHADVDTLAVGGDEPSSSRNRPRTRKPSPVVLDPDDVNSEDVDPYSRQNSGEPRPIPDEVIPSAGGIAPASYAGSGRGGSDEDDAPPVRASQRARRGSTSKVAPASRPRKSSIPPDDAAESSGTEPSDSGSEPPRRPTWRDLSIKSSGVPVDESVHQSSGEESADEPGQVKLAGLRGSSVIPREVEPGQFRLPAAALRPAEATNSRSKTSQSECQFDTTDQRIVDFQLPGLDGKMVSFKDFDADVILLDFWGSWCTQCRKSIAFDRDLLAKVGTNRVKVIGIACEKGATLEERRASAAKATRKLGINYPVLVSSMDATCPLQKALQVQFYPTLVVLDREGRILHSERGATDATLSRTSRSVMTALDEADSRLR
jgi:peroxiredoxin